MLAALISACQESVDGSGLLRAELPVAGSIVAERQARLAAAAGAGIVIFYVERLPRDLVAAVDRLRGDGLDVRVARNAGEAAAMAGPDDRLMILADGLIADGGHLATLAEAVPPSLIVVPDRKPYERHERIDADWRWSGLGLLDGAMLGEVAARLGEWDLSSTLLRRALQAGARFIPIGEEATPPLMLVRMRADLPAVEKGIRAAAARPEDDWVSRHLLAPLEALAARWLARRRLRPRWLYVATAALAGIAAFCFAKGWLSWGFLLLMLSTPLTGTARRLAALALEVRQPSRKMDQAITITAAVALVALTEHLADGGQWGFWPAAGGILAFLIAARIERGGRGMRGSALLADRKTLIWAALPFALFGYWGLAYISLFLYAALSFFWVQQQALTARSGDGED
ncbi:MAG: hypothetical protein ACFBQW_07400 [Sphingomonadaceae bacterium]